MSNSEDIAPSMASPLQSAEDGGVDSSRRLDKDKASAVLEACKWRNLHELRSLADSPGGFLTDSLRQHAWPILLGLPVANDKIVQDDLTADQGADTGAWKELPSHRDEEQVQLDVMRAFVYYPNDQSDSEREHQKIELSDLIVEVLRRHPYLCYFQGYHDICQVLLLVLPHRLRVPAVARLSALRIRDFMLPTLRPAVSQLQLIPDILRASDPALWRHLSGTQPFFALSGTLTMYAHDITSLGEITRLFDVLLAREPVFSVYMFAAIVLSRREELFDTPEDEPEMLHSILSKLPRPLDLDKLIGAAIALAEAHPPETLRSWRKISHASVLKTARSIDASTKQTMEDGRKFFDRQVKELHWAERREKMLALAWKYRRPARNAGLAILVVLLGMWLRRSPGPASYLSALFTQWFR